MVFAIASYINKINSMKYILSLCVACMAFAFNSFSQIKNPTTLAFSAIKKGANYEVIIKATIAKPWHMYSQKTPSGGPLPTKISFNKNPLITIVGNTKEVGKLEKINDKNFGVDVLYFSNEVIFSQIVKVKAGVKTNITGTIEYMVCDDSQCLPPTKKPFDIKLL
jgi:Disulphide bond corrector protein DsbC